MGKKPIKIFEKARVVHAIINAMNKREHFLVIGHKNPDEDCIGSMVAFALLLNKFQKDAMIYLSGKIHEHYQYLINICEYNSIKILQHKRQLHSPVDTIIVCDTAKPEMLDVTPEIEQLMTRDGNLVMEIDHHIGSDSEYIGREGYRLVDSASSTCELIGHLMLRLKQRKGLIKKYQIENLISRNLVLAILTGIIGDTNNGMYFKTNKERRFYGKFTSIYNRILARETVKKSNFSSKNEIFQELRSLSTAEQRCFSYFMSRKRFSKFIGYVALSKKDVEFLMNECENDTIISVARSVADQLAEKSKKLSLVAYYDLNSTSKLIQFRVRRSQVYKEFDLRSILIKFSIANGGGHEGAIGFRIPESEVLNFEEYIKYLIIGIEEELK